MTNFKLNKLLITAIFLFVACSFCIDQGQNVTGVVKNEDGETLPGVNVVIQGTTIGTITDVNGLYSIKISDLNDDILVFSFIGYETKKFRRLLCKNSKF